MQSKSGMCPTATPRDTSVIVALSEQHNTKNPPYSYGGNVSDRPAYTHISWGVFSFFFFLASP